MKILLIDDHKLIKMGIRILLEEQDNYKISECSNYKESIEKFEKDSFDLIICDISLPDKSGYDILEYIKEKKIITNVIILSMYEDKNYVKKALQLGAKGYVTKSTAHEEILKAIEVVMNENEVYVHNKYSSIFYDIYKSGVPIVFSEREKEVAKYMLKGYSLTEIGEKLYLSVKTIDTYKKRLMDKTNTKKRSELINYLRQQVIE